MLRLHWTTFSLRPYHVLKIQERGEDGVKMKQFRISKFPLCPYYVPATSLLRPHHVLTTSLLRPSRFHYVLNKRSPSSSRFHYVLATYSQRPSSSYHARTTFPVRSNCKYTLRQKFSIIICVKGDKNIWLELIPANKDFDTIVSIRCHGYGGNNQDFYGFKMGS